MLLNGLINRPIIEQLKSCPTWALRSLANVAALGTQAISISGMSLGCLWFLPIFGGMCRGTVTTILGDCECCFLPLPMRAYP